MKRIDRVPPFCWSTLLLLLALGAGERAFGEEVWTHNGSVCCPSQGPIIEQEPGSNLFWHDPYCPPNRGCPYMGPEAIGYPPTWYARGDAMVLWRDTDNSFDFAKGAGALLSTSQFKSEGEVAGRFLLGVALSDWYRLEGSFFGTGGWSDTASLRDTTINDLGTEGDLRSPFTDFGNPRTVGLDYNTFASIRYASDLNNAEINLRRRVVLKCFRHHYFCHWPVLIESSFLIGVRFAQINEDFNYFTQSNEPAAAGSTTDVHVRTRNDMIGIQLGWLGQVLFHPRYWVDFELKGAAFTNDARQRTIYNNDTGGVVTSFDGSAQRDRTTFVGDFSIQGNYQLTRSITFNAGYSAIVFTGVALADQNFNTDVNVLALGPAALDHSGTVLYHGFNFGLVYAR